MEIVEHLLMLERESLSIGSVNQKIVQLGGEPIRFRAHDEGPGDAHTGRPEPARDGRDQDWPGHLEKRV